MEVKQETKPVIFLVDDDVEITILVSTWLKNLDYKVVCFENPVDFLAKIKEKKPNLCIVDINFNERAVGLKLVQAIRTVLGRAFPILIHSVDDDPHTISSAMNLGADDYLVKPISRGNLLEKIEKYINFEYFDFQDVWRGIPDEYRRVHIIMDFEVEEIDEFGIKIKGPELLSKGCFVLLRSDLIVEISQNDKPIVGSVISNWIHPVDRTAGAFIQFDPSNEIFLVQVRSWIAGKNRVKK